MPMERKASAAKKAAKRKPGSREVTGTEAVKVIDAYVQRKNAALQNLALELRKLVKKTLPASREAINPWGVPTFDLEGPLAIMMIGKNHITFGLIRGTSLTDSKGLLEGTGKNLRHVKLSDAAQLRNPHLHKLIIEAAALNRKTPPTSSMRVKN
jgi:hypothetical protein